MDRWPFSDMYHYNCITRPGGARNNHKWNRGMLKMGRHIYRVFQSATISPVELKGSRVGSVIPHQTTQRIAKTLQQ